MFQPPRCPYRRCSQHAKPTGTFYVRKGTYRPLCRAQPVPRFRCRSCGRYFSRQTFRADYRDHRPHLNSRVFESIASGLGLRQTARNLGISRRCCELKFRKIARHLRRLNVNLRDQLPDDCRLQFDEFETYEGRRNTRPLSVPVLIEAKTRFVVWAETATIRPHGRMSDARKRALLHDESQFGPRRDNSGNAIRRTLLRGAALVRGASVVVLETDEKSSYPRHAKEAFGSRLRHRTTHSKLARMTWNPLFAINHTEAMLRDLLGRLRRDSWLASKKRRYLDHALHVFIAYRNYVRKRFNYDEESPAQLLGFTPRRLLPKEVLSWRQDWGASSSIAPWDRALAR